jgi:DNA-binding transcriptional LysR family regulator
MLRDGDKKETMAADKLSGIEAFVTAVDAGSFAQAAQRLFLTRSAIGKSIARLEQRLGTRLLLRNTRSLELTQSGEAFYARCQRILAELEAAQCAIDDSRKTPKGIVRISAPVLFGRRCVSPVLLQLSERYPQLEFEALYTDSRVDMVAQRIDLVVRSGPMEDSSDIIARHLGEQTQLLCASPAYLRKHGRPASFRELASHKAVAYAHDGKLKPWQFFDSQGKAHDIAPPTQLRFDDLESVAAAAVAGAGLARLPSWLLSDYLQTGALQQVFKEDKPSQLALHLAWPKARQLPPRTRVVVEALAQALPDLLHS